MSRQGIAGIDHGFLLERRSFFCPTGNVIARLDSGFLGGKSAGEKI
jgi:hypothetical protein